MATPELSSTQIEYGPSAIVPLPAIPRLLSFQIEYKALPRSGFLAVGVPTTTLDLSVIADTDQTYRIEQEEIQGYVEVYSNAEFSSELDWRYFVVQYKHIPSGQIKNIIVRKNGLLWEGITQFTAGAPTGLWTKRSIMIKVFDGAELILLPSTFAPGESLTLVP